MIKRNLLRDALDHNEEEEIEINKLPDGRFDLTGEGIRATVIGTDEVTEVEIYATSPGHFSHLYDAIREAAQLAHDLIGEHELIVFYAHQLARKNSKTIQETFEPTDSPIYFRFEDITQPI